MCRTYWIATLGCKVNQQESETLKARFEELGFLPALKGAADVCVINSCTVTSVADSKTRQRIRQARAENPGAFVCVIGCMPEVRREEVSSMPEVDLVVGSLEKCHTADLILQAIVSRDLVCENSEYSYGDHGGRISASARPGRPQPLRTERTRAFLKVEDGCDRYCAYCIIPYARGPVRSRPAEDVLREAEALLAAGYRELVMTGINLALYGKDFLADFGDDASGLYELTNRLCSLGYEYRVRLGSLEPTVIDAGEAARIAGIKGVCPQLHLSLQSGAARTLAAMGRAYSPEEYEEIVRVLRGIDPLFSVTTDVIVGFPGETEADFNESAGFVKRMAFARVHVFKYSRRPGTRAAGMDGQVSEALKNERSRIMLQAAKESEERFLALNEGKARQVLIYGPDKSGKRIRGLTDNGIDVTLPAGRRYEPNTFVIIELDTATAHEPLTTEY